MRRAPTTETDLREVTPTSPDPRRALGLLRPAGQRTIPIHMLYEAGGSALYEAIERHPDYYLYETERELLERHAAEIAAALPRHAVIVELGCGDCTKTRILLDALVRSDGRAHLVGIDSSADALASTRARFEADPDVEFTAIHDTFFDGLARAAQQHQGRDLCVLLLGSTLGNMSFAESVLFLRTIVEVTTRGSGSSTRVLLGLDMWQDEGRLRRAYHNDITERFELNGLRNAIRSVDRGHVFDPDDWCYVVEVNADLNQVEMLAEAVRPVSFAGQRVERGERILLEVSHKFRGQELERLFAGCAVVSTHGDAYRMFVLAAAERPLDNPWTRYSDADLSDVDGVARIDYGAFIARYDWGRLADGDVALLDVGCGSGAVARMMRGYAGARRLSRATAGIIVATMFFGGAAIVDKALVSEVGLSPNSVLVVAFLPPGLLLGVLALRRCEAPWAALRRVLRTRRIYVNAMIIGLSYGAVYRAYGLGGSASGVTMILAAEAVLVVLVAAVALRERERLAAKLLASALTVLGVYLVRGPGHLP